MLDVRDAHTIHNSQRARTSADKEATGTICGSHLVRPRHIAGLFGNQCSVESNQLGEKIGPKRECFNILG
jgi:hypothetical protein